MNGENGNSKGQTGSLPSDRVRAVLSAYGASRERWPAQERDAVEAGLDRDAALRALAVEEAALDTKLARAPALSIPDPLRARLVADFEAFAERQTRKLRVRLVIAVDSIREFIWPGSPWWKPVFAFSLSVFLGASAGLFVLAPLTELDEGDQVAASPISSPQAADLELDD